VVSNFNQQTTFNNRLGQFFNEQRHTIGPIDDLVSDLLGQRLSPRQVADHLGALSRL
jgi:hypothetical protein